MAVKRKNATSSIKDFRRHTETGRKKSGRPLGSKSKKTLSEFIEFSPEELIKIITACKKSEVGSFSYGGLKIGFGQELSQTGTIPVAGIDEVDGAVGGEAFSAEEVETQAALDHDKARSITDEELQQMTIEDPVRAEQIMMGVGDA